MKAAAALCTMLLLSGCASISLWGGGTPEDKIHAGTKGLVIALDKTNPTTAYSGDVITLYGTLTNDGTADVDNAQLVISADNKFLQLAESGTRTAQLLGRAADTPVGEQMPLRIGVKALTLGPSQENANGEVRFDICYPYKTDASAQVCIDPDIQSKTTKPCTMGTLTLGGGQGAPVAVTRVETVIVREQNKPIPIFSITLSNAGDGQASMPGATTCGSGSYNRASVRAWLADQPLTCEDGESAEVIFDKTRSTVRCKLAKGIDGTAAFSSVLRVEASYDYTNKPVVARIMVTQR
jgi:hypothetical protein